MGFKINEIDDVITSRITVRIAPGAMLVQAALQLVRDSGVEETSVTVAEDVDVMSSHPLLLPLAEADGKGHEM